MGEKKTNIGAQFVVVVVVGHLSINDIYVKNVPTIDCKWFPFFVFGCYLVLFSF